MNTGAQKLAFGATSRLTDAFPAFGARLLDASLRPTKLYETCRVVRCFEHLDVTALGSVVVSYHAGLTGPAAAGPQRLVMNRAPA
jgi:hypothetical protein